MSIVIEKEILTFLIYLSCFIIIGSNSKFNCLGIVYRAFKKLTKNLCTEKIGGLLPRGGFILRVH